MRYEEFDFKEAILFSQLLPVMWIWFERMRIRYPLNLVNADPESDPDPISCERKKIVS